MKKFQNIQEKIFKNKKNTQLFCVFFLPLAIFSCSVLTSALKKSAFKAQNRTF